jgi:hypothetical protein
MTERADRWWRTPRANNKTVNRDIRHPPGRNAHPPRCQDVQRVLPGGAKKYSDDPRGGDLIHAAASVHAGQQIDVTNLMQKAGTVGAVPVESSAVLGAVDRGQRS